MYLVAVITLVALSVQPNVLPQPAARIVQADVETQTLKIRARSIDDPTDVVLFQYSFADDTDPIFSSSVFYGPNSFPELCT
jgi:hypothetical protein